MADTGDSPLLRRWCGYWADVAAGTDDGQVSLRRVHAGESGELAMFLGGVDLTLAGVDAAGLHLWVQRDASGQICASTGFELSRDGEHALVRSVAVAPGLRGAGVGS